MNNVFFETSSVFCEICDLNVTGNAIKSHATKHLRESAIMYAKTGQSTISAPIKFTESIKITDWKSNE